MLPVVESDGRSTARQILMYGAALLPTTLAPTMLGMAGLPYFVGASALGLGLFYFCARIWSECLPPSTPRSRILARTLSQGHRHLPSLAFCTNDAEQRGLIRTRLATEEDV